MRLLDITMFYAPASGGVKRYLTAKHAWLGAHTAIHHTLLVPGTHTRPRNEHGVATLREPLVPAGHGYRLPLRVRRWARAVREIAPDLIEAGDPYQLAWLALRMGGELDVPVVSFYHSDLPRLVGARCGAAGRRWAQSYVRNMYRHFDLVLAPSQVMVNGLRDLGIERVRRQPLGVDTLCFAPWRRDPALRDQLGLSPRTRLLIYAGRFAREKNLPVLFEAMRRLGRDYHLLLVGAGLRLPYLSNVTRWPYCPNAAGLAALIASCDALVHPGDRETFGLIVLEAMACGLPVIGTEAGAVAELVDDEVGLRVPPRDAEALAQAIVALYERDPPALGAAARRRVEGGYSWERVLPQLLGQYFSLPALAGRTAIGPIVHAAE